MASSFQELINAQNSQIKNWFDNQLQQKSIAPFYLFIGASEHTQEMSTYFIEQLVAKENRAFDVLYFSPQGAAYTVEEIQQVRSQLKTPPGLGAYKVCVLNEGHLLSPIASNMLLKILEEPICSVVLILRTPASAFILPTLLSRAVQIAFNGAASGDLLPLELMQQLKSLVKEGESWSHHALIQCAQWMGKQLDRALMPLFLEELLRLSRERWALDQPEYYERAWQLVLEFKVLFERSSSVTASLEGLFLAIFG